MHDEGRQAGNHDKRTQIRIITLPPRNHTLHEEPCIRVPCSNQDFKGSILSKKWLKEIGINQKIQKE